LSQIAIDINIGAGKPCIWGHRIWVALIVGVLVVGEMVEGLLKAYPSIERDDILDCVADGAEILEGAD
jgi:uncharacterized protein (DUF433 family)